MQQPTKEQKKEIKEVLKKYIGLFERDYLDVTAQAAFLGGTVGAPLGLVVDLLLTGGVFTGLTCLITSGTIVGSIGLQQRHSRRPYIWNNEAKQEIESAHLVHCALERMEDKLRKTFQKAAANKDSRSCFLNMKAEIEGDTRKLAPVFKIVSGGPYNLGTDQFEFVLEKKWPEFQLPKIKTASQEENEASTIHRPPATPAMLKIL